MYDVLFVRGDKARREAKALAQQLADLRELRALELDLDRVVRGLATALDASGALTGERLRRFLELRGVVPFL